MEIILNSKFFAELPPPQLGTKVKSLGYDGLDLCVRPGHPVHPGNVTTALHPAMKVWKDQGLSCPFDAVRVLRDMHVSGPFSVHTEYGMDAGEPALERTACEDAAYLRQCKRSVPMQRGAWRCVGRVYRVTELACGRSEGAGWL